jgi:bacterioferritin
MKGSEKVIAALNGALQEDVTAINQYFLHSEMCENWGYERVAKYVRKLSIVEMKHAEKLIERILFLDGAPNMAAPIQLNVGKAVKQQLENDLNLELGAVKLYNDAVKLVRAEGDNGSAQLLRSILQDEEEHADWQETQLRLIKEIGNELYLSEQTKKE